MLLWQGDRVDDWIDACLDTVDRCWSGLTAIVSELGDQQINRRPGLVGANSAYAIVHHCVELSRWWLGTFGCGLDLDRDRSGEFEAQGGSEELLARVVIIRDDTVTWVNQLMTQGIAGRHATGTTASADLATVTPQWVVLHVVHELAQHLGQLQLTRDLLTDQGPKTRAP